MAEHRRMDDRALGRHLHVRALCAGNRTVALRHRAPCTRWFRCELGAIYGPDADVGRR